VGVRAALARRFFNRISKDVVTSTMPMSITKSVILNPQAKTGKMTDAEKQSFRDKRAAKRRYNDNDRLARWDRATSAQDALRTRLIGIETALAKPAGSYTPKQYEAMRRELGAISAEMKDLKGIVRRMSAMDRAAIMGRDAENLAKGQNSVIDNGDRLALREFREWMKNSDNFEGRIDGLARTNRIDALVYDTKRQAGNAAPATLADLLHALGDPTRPGLGDLTELAALGLDATALISALTAPDIKPKRAALANALAGLKRDSDKARDSRKKRRLALKEPAEKAVKPAPAKTAKKPKAPTLKTATLEGDFSGPFVGTQMGIADGATLKSGRLIFSVSGQKVRGKATGSFVFYGTENKFSATANGTYDRTSGKINGSINGRFHGRGGGGLIIGKFTGRATADGFSGTWKGENNAGRWGASATGAPPQSWAAYMCQNYRDAFQQSGGVCK